VYSVGWDGALIERQDLDPSVDELLDWIESNCHVRDLTCDEATSHGIEIYGCP
jgi:hypothetical protein